ncbi:hypothetical protein [Halorussus salinisoli]|uniref:hypothetical protein n=1 Tax=Halorussus salinisoli TaxID=2558242 RepID=UPI0014850A8B|nr:hypothetical protein [Halorussus salinisoli]
MEPTIALLDTGQPETTIETVETDSRSKSTTSHEFPAGGDQQASQFRHAVLVAAYFVFAGVSLLLVTLGVVTTSAAVLPSGPLGVVLILTVGLGLMVAAPTLARWAFITGLNAIERWLVSPDTDSVPTPAYDEDTAVALQVLALHDAGQSESAIEAATGLPQATIATILDRRGEYLAAAAQLGGG